VALPWGSRPETCQVRSYRAWKVEAGVREGAVFRGINNRGQIASEVGCEFGGANRETGRPARRP
jgi:hypothetical protein